MDVGTVGQHGTATIQQPGAGELRDRPRDALRESFGWPLVLYFLGIIFLLTLAPFHFTWPAHPRFNVRFLAGDMASNVLLFFPLGFVYRLCLDRSERAWQTALAASGVSVVIETFQLFVPERVTSPQDVLANACGAWFGAVVCDLVLVRLTSRRIHEVVIELPLAVVFYLLLPLFWANSVLADRDPQRTWMTVPIGIMGGWIVGAIGHHRLGPAGIRTPAGVLAVTTIWFVLANLLDLARRPTTSILALFFVILAVSLLLCVPTLAFGRWRRFERAILLRVMPLYLAYLGLVAITPMSGFPSQWSATMGLDLLDPSLRGAPIRNAFLVIEHIAGYTILGYLAAGLRGRRRESRWAMLLGVAIVCAIIAGAVEVLRGFDAGKSASLARGIVAVAAGTYGGYLYRMHLRTVWRVLGRLPAGIQ